MNPDQVERLLRELGEQRPAERMFDALQSAALRDELMGLPAKQSGSGIALTGRRQRMNLLVAALAAFALAGVFFPGPAGQPPMQRAIGLHADWASSRLDLFRTERHAGQPAENVWVGVRVDRAAFVSIFAINADGSGEFLQLSRDGAITIEIGPDTATSFGGYLRVILDNGAKKTLHTLLVVASERPLPSAPIPPSSTVPDVDAIADELRRNHPCTVRVLKLPDAP
ncbi:MAG: hypothetical protein AMXMBFR47_36010 [Planctomycetota bacterium]